MTAPGIFRPSLAFRAAELKTLDFRLKACGNDGLRHFPALVGASRLTVGLQTLMASAMAVWVWFFPGMTRMVYRCAWVSCV